MEHFEPFSPSEEQAKNNPNKYWEGFFGQKVQLIEEALRAGRDVDAAVNRIIAEALAEVPESKRGFVTGEELYLRGLELYAKDGGGFGDGPIKKTYLSKIVPFLVRKLHTEDFDTVDLAFQEEVASLQRSGEFLSPDDIKRMRSDFGKQFGEMKSNEYAEEAKNPEREDTDE